MQRKFEVILVLPRKNRKKTYIESKKQIEEILPCCPYCPNSQKTANFAKDPSVPFSMMPSKVQFFTASQISLYTLSGTCLQGLCLCLPQLQITAVEVCISIPVMTVLN